MVAGPVTITKVETTSTSFTAHWTKAARSDGYAWITRDLTAHKQVGSGFTDDTSATVGGLTPGGFYNFGVQGLPGGPGTNRHVRLPGGGAGTAATSSKKVPKSLPRLLGGSTYQVFAAGLMIAHGWGLGQQWTDFRNIVQHESGWNPNARNPSGAYGIAQALGHGTADTAAADGENAYGNFGTPDAVCRAANSGNGYAQLIWMCNYIAEKYGSPAVAWGYDSQGSY